MTARKLLTEAVRRKMSGARVDVELTEDGYAVLVVWGKFRGVRPADREAWVYDAIANLPVELLAKVWRIDCESSLE